MYGVDSRVPSRTIALCCAYCWIVVWLVLPPCPARSAASRPRLYSFLVMSWNSCEPWPVKARTTSGWPVFGSVSARIPDSTRSFPVSSGGPFVAFGWYLNRYQYVLSFEVPFVPAPMQPVDCGHLTTVSPAGTASTCVPAGCLPPYWENSSFGVPSGPSRSWCLVVVTFFLTVLPLTFELTFFVTALLR